MGNKRMVDVEIKIHHETEDAYLVSTTTVEKTWIPKRIRKDEEPYEVDEIEGGYALITVPEWWAVDKELV